MHLKHVFKLWTETKDLVVFLLHAQIEMLRQALHSLVFIQNWVWMALVLLNLNSWFCHILTITAA